MVNAFFAERLMYRSNRTLETENFKEISSAMHFGSDAVVCVLGEGGEGLKDRPSMLLACVI